MRAWSCPAWKARINSNPVNSPAAPAAGCKVAARMPVISHSASSSSTSTCSHPWQASAGAAGCTLAKLEEAAAWFADLRVVLHGARTEWVRAQIDGVLAVRQAREMANEIAFGDFAYLDRFASSVLRWNEVVDSLVRKFRGAETPGLTSWCRRVRTALVPRRSRSAEHSWLVPLRPGRSFSAPPCSTSRRRGQSHEASGVRVTAMRRAFPHKGVPSKPSRMAIPARMPESSIRSMTSSASIRRERQIRAQSGPSVAEDHPLSSSRASL